jgi:hypothetical protein
MFHTAGCVRGCSTTNVACLFGFHRVGRPYQQQQYEQPEQRGDRQLQWQSEQQQQEQQQLRSLCLENLDFVTGCWAFFYIKYAVVNKIFIKFIAQLKHFIDICFQVVY